MIYDHQRVIWIRTQATDSQIGDVLKQRDEALTALVDAERRAEGSLRAYALSEKYHNEDLTWMEKIIAAANSVVSGPDSVNHERLATLLDEYENWRMMLPNVANSVADKSSTADTPQPNAETQP